MTTLKNLLNNLRQDESGQDLIEYALVAGLIGLTCVSAMTNLATSIVTTFTNMGNSLSTAI